MKRYLVISGLTVGAMLSAAPAWSVPSVTFSPASSQINIGDTVSVEMSISGLGDEILSAFDINLLFNESIVNNTVVTHSACTDTGFGFYPDDCYIGVSSGTGNTGVIDGSYLDDPTLAASQLNAFVVLTFWFQGVSNGATTLSLGLDPDFERNFVGLDFQSLSLDIGTACIAVGTGSCDQQSVPEPGTLALLGLGLVGLGFGRTRRQS